MYAMIDSSLISDMLLGTWLLVVLGKKYWTMVKWNFHYLRGISEECSYLEGIPVLLAYVNVDMTVNIYSWKSL